MADDNPEPRERGANHPSAQAETQQDAPADAPIEQDQKSGSKKRGRRRNGPSELAPHDIPPNPIFDVSGPSDGQNISVGDLIEEYRRRAEIAANDEESANQARYKALAGPLDLYYLTKDNEEKTQELEAAFRRNKIRDTKRTHIFTRLIKLLFVNPKHRKKVNHYATVLRYAADCKIQPDDLPEFITKNGGTTGCVKLEKRSREPDAAGNPVDIDAKLNAVPEITLELDNPPSEGFSLILLPKGDGRYAVLGSRKVSANILKKYLS